MRTNNVKWSAETTSSGNAFQILNTRTAKKCFIQLTVEFGKWVPTCVYNCVNWPARSVPVSKLGQKISSNMNRAWCDASLRQCLQWLCIVCRMAEVTSLSIDDVIGRSLYQFCCVNDLTTLRRAHIEGGTFAEVMWSKVKCIGFLIYSVYGLCRVSKLVVFIWTLLGYDKTLGKRSRGPGKSWRSPGIFCKQERHHHITAFAMAPIIQAQQRLT